MDEKTKQTMLDMGYVPASRGAEQGWVFDTPPWIRSQRGHSIMRPDPRTTRWYVYQWINGERQAHKVGPFTTPVAAATFMRVELSQ